MDVLASKKRFGNSSSDGQNRLITELDETEKSTRQAAMVGEDVSKTRGLVIARHEAISQQARGLASLVTVGCRRSRPFSRCCLLARLWLSTMAAAKIWWRLS